MTEFQPRLVKVELTDLGFDSLRRLMDLTGKSYAQITNEGIEKADSAYIKGQPCHIPEGWHLQDRDNGSSVNLRLPTPTLRSLDRLASQAEVTWEDIASFILECEVFDSLQDLEL